tara:strand:+ start:11831 stop:12085 length:255 start_codon:yes stop_codon:yes gene_type:complete
LIVYFVEFEAYRDSFSSRVKLMDGVEPTTVVVIRLACFVAILIGMAIWELFLPRRKLVAGKPWRWTSNLSLGGKDIQSCILRTV